MARFGLATLNHSPLHGLPTRLAAHLDAAAAAGFDALAPDLFWLRALEAEGTSLEALRDALDRRGLACMEIAGLAIGREDRTKAELAENLRAAELLGAEFVNTRVVAAVDVERVRRCAEALASAGSRLALEFSQATRLPDLTAARALVEAVDVPGVGLTLDTWHFVRGAQGPDWKALEELPIERLANVQLSDGPEATGPVPEDDRDYVETTMNERRFPAEGAFDLPRIARSLRAADFDGAVVVEVLSAAERKRELAGFAARAGRSARAWWAA